MPTDRPPAISLIVPTRGRPLQLRRFLDSVARTAHRPDRLEVVLVVDDDDPGSLEVDQPRLAIRRVVTPPGRTMGRLNSAGYAASSGDFIMLLNDDVVIRTRGWDRIVLRCFRQFPDGVALIHVNDTLIEDYLCTFPLVSRVYCELAGGVCPHEYERYRIDDHIEDAFNLLARLGERRAIYLPDVVFEHLNAVVHPEAGRVYMSDPEILARDAPLFDSLFHVRKALALRLLDYMEKGSDPAVTRRREEILAGIDDPFSLRTPGRQRIVRTSWRNQLRDKTRWSRNLPFRAYSCLRKKGWRGLLRAVGRGLFSQSQ